MKINRNEIAEDLRVMGDIYKVVLNYSPAKSIFKSKPVIPKQAKRDRTAYSEYIRKDDGTYIRLLIHKPKSEYKNIPIVLWIHGGGYATGMPEMIYMSMAKNLFEECVVVSPEYRLSSHDPYPAALEDCYCALKWIKEYAHRLGCNPNQIFVGGESAGGGLTAALCLYARDRKEVNIACQMPLYPMLDYRGDTESMRNNNAPVWNEKRNIAGWNLYLEGQTVVSKYASPALETDYRNLPMAFTFVGDIEPFYDETVTYINHLKQAGVPAEIKVMHGCYHAFDMMVPMAKETKEAKEYFMDCFHYACKNAFASNL